MGFAAWIVEVLSGALEFNLLTGHRRRRPDIVALANGPEDSPASRFLGRHRTLKG
jgi:hypothetical protein